MGVINTQKQLQKYEKLQKKKSTGFKYVLLPALK